MTLVALALSASRYFRRRHQTPLGAQVPPPSLEGFDADAVRFASRAWTMRGEEEHHSAAIFTDALSYLTDAGVPLDLLAALARIVGDELRHAELCLDMAKRFEADLPRSRPLARGTTPPDAESRRARGLAIVLVEGAIGETISSALFNAGRHVAEEPSTRAALGLILRDEVLHARAFCEALSVLVPTLADAERDALHRAASRAFGALEQSQALPSLKRLERNESFDPAWGALGVLPPDARVEAFYGAIEKRAIPRLNALGLDGDRAWHDRYGASKREVR